MDRVHAGDIIAGSFQFVRDHLKAVLVWSAIYLVIMLAMQLAMRPMMMAQLTAGPGSVTPFASGLFRQMLLGLLGAYLFMIAVLTVLQAAIFRAALFPDRREISYLRLSGDELRLFGLLLILAIGFFIAFLIAAFAVEAVVFVMVGLGGVMRVLGVLLGIAGGLAMIVAPIFFVVRLASAGPLTILRKKITIGEAWRLTRGHFWTLFGSYAVVAVVWIIVAIVIVQLSLGSGMQQAMMQQMTHPGDPLYQQQVVAMQFQQFTNFGPVRLLSLAISAILWGLLIALQCGSIAVATRLLLNEHEPAAVF
jgi:hypothetical protein